MGCDIHSRAEIRLNGEWQMLGDVFPNTSTMRWFQPTREFLDEATDGVLMDIISGRTSGLSESLQEKVSVFAKGIHERLEEARHNKDLNSQITTDENGEYDRHGWHRWSMVEHEKFAAKADLSEEEREQIRVAILNYRFYTMEEWIEEGFDLDEFDTSDENILTVIEHRLPEDDIDWYQNEPLDSRNYTLFAVIANVRNGDGGVEPIAEAKGSSENPAPEDASPEVVKHQNRYGIDGHSHQWLTLAEIEAYDLSGTVTYSGLVASEDFEAMKQKGWPDAIGCGPDSWAGGVGSGICFTPEAYDKWVAINRPRVEVNADGMVYRPNVFPGDLPDEVQPPTAPADTWLEYHNEDDGPLTYEHCRRLKNRFFRSSRYVYNGMRNVYVYAEWKENREKTLGDEFANMVRIFRKLVDEHNITPDDIRLVCFFDN